MPIDPLQPESLPVRLKVATAVAHASAERSLLMRRLMCGELPRANYCRLLMGLCGVYRELDAAVQRHATALWHPALARGPALVSDLQCLQGDDWQLVLDEGEQALAYAARLRQQAAAGSHRLLAHAYVRYLGDLHGGQMLAAAVQRSYALAPGRGVAFYDFGPAQQVLSLRQHLRSALAAWPLAATEADEVVDEARWAFGAHERMFAELA